MPAIEDILRGTKENSKDYAREKIEIGGQVFELEDTLEDKERGLLTIKSIRSNNLGTIVRFGLEDSKGSKIDIELEKKNDSGKEVKTVWKIKNSTKKLYVNFPNKNYEEEPKGEQKKTPDKTIKETEKKTEVKKNPIIEELNIENLPAKNPEELKVLREKLGEEIEDLKAKLDSKKLPKAAEKTMRGVLLKKIDEVKAVRETEDKKWQEDLRANLGEEKQSLILGEGKLLLSGKTVIKTGKNSFLVKKIYKLKSGGAGFIMELEENRKTTLKTAPEIMHMLETKAQIINPEIPKKKSRWEVEADKVLNGTRLWSTDGATRGAYITTDTPKDSNGKYVFESEAANKAGRKATFKLTKEQLLDAFKSEKISLLPKKEEVAISPQKEKETTPLEPVELSPELEKISEEEWWNFMNKGVVKKETLQRVAERYEKGLNLTPREINLLDKNLSEIKKILNKEPDPATPAVEKEKESPKIKKEPAKPAKRAHDPKTFLEDEINKIGTPQNDTEIKNLAMFKGELEKIKNEETRLAEEKKAAEEKDRIAKAREDVLKKLSEKINFEMPTAELLTLAGELKIEIKKMAEEDLRKIKEWGKDMETKNPDDWKILETILSSTPSDLVKKIENWENVAKNPPSEVLGKIVAKYLVLFHTAIKLFKENSSKTA